VQDTIEKLDTLRNASYFLNKATTTFIRDNNNVGCYSSEIQNRFEDGLTLIQELLDREYEAIQDKLLKDSL